MASATLLTRAAPCPAARLAPARSRGMLRTNAMLGGGRGPLQTVQSQAAKFLQRYEHNLLSSGVGALAVTSYCVARGQSPATAAAITVVATVSALVLNELLFSSDDTSS